MQEQLPGDVTAIERELSLRSCFAAGAAARSVSQCDVIGATRLYQMRQREGRNMGNRQ